MKRTIAVLDFLKYSVSDKIEFYKYVAVQMANTVLFPTLDIPLATINKAIADFEAAALAAGDGAHSAMAIRDDKELIADNVFRQLVIFVNKVAGGDATIIIQSGFNISKEPTPISKAEMSINDGPHSGTVMVVLKVVKGAVAYKIHYRIISANGQITEWIEVDITTITTCLIENLIPGQKYEFKFASISSAGTTDFCQPIAKIVI